MKALVAWTIRLRQRCSIDPIFAHVDKDMDAYERSGSLGLVFAGGIYDGFCVPGR